MIVSSEGDLGDIIYMMCILSQIDGPHTLLIEGSSVTKANGLKGAERLLDGIERLALSQPYISEIRLKRHDDIVEWRSAGFRDGYTFSGHTLMSAHLDHLVRVTGIGRDVDTTRQWLFADQPVKEPITQSTESRDRVVISRTSRYTNSSFRWGRVVDHYGERLIFVGTGTEHQEFCRNFGEVEHVTTKDMFDVACLIAGSSLFIGNQSSPFAIAEGLKHDSIQETSLRIPDCIFKRDNVQHVHNGDMRLPDIGGSGEGIVTRARRDVAGLSTMTTPPGGWQFPGVAPAITMQKMQSVVSSLPEWSDKTQDEIRLAILTENYERCPEFWGGNSTDYKIKLAAEFAGY